MAKVEGAVVINVVSSMVVVVVTCVVEKVGMLLVVDGVG